MTDEHLDRLERLLEELIERQRLSRFDTLMFLAYPAIISGTVLLANVISQAGTYVSVTILGVPILTIVIQLALLFVFGLVASFLLFLFAYARDDIVGRSRTCRFLVYQTVGLVALVEFPLSSLIQDLAQGDILGTVLRLTTVLSFAISLCSLWASEVVLPFQDRIRLWFRRNIPNLLEREKIVAKTTSPHEKRFVRRVGIFFWLVALASYGATIALALSRGLPISGLVGYHVLVLGCLLALTIIAFMRKRQRKGKSSGTYENGKAIATA